MTITFPCAGCGKQYKSGAENAGKQMRCDACGQAIRIPVPRSRDKPATSETSHVVSCPNCAAPCRIRPEWRGQTLECPTCRKHFVVPQAGSRTARTAGPVASERDDYLRNLVDEDESSPAHVLPPREETARSNPIKKSRSRHDFDWSNAPMWATIIVSIALLGLIGFAAVSRPAAVLLLAVGCLLLLSGSLWLLSTPFQESFGCGMMFMFVPFYSLYYTFSRWTDTWKPFATYLTGFVLVMLAPGLNTRFRESLFSEPGADQAAPGGAVGGGGFVQPAADRPAAPRHLGPSVTLRIANVPNEDVRYFIQEKVRGFVDPGRGSSVNYVGPDASAVLTVTVSPVSDPSAFAKKVDFGTVTRINGTMIEVTADSTLATTVPKSPPRPAAAASRPSAPVKVESVKVESVDQAIELLKSTDASARASACEGLARLTPNEQRDEVAKLLTSALQDPKDSVVESALKALRAWGDSDCTPAVLDVFEKSTSRSAVYKEAMATLGRFPNEEAAVAVANEVTDFFIWKEALAALKAMGPVAEAGIAKILPKLEHFNRDEVLKLVASIADKKQLEPATVSALIEYIDSRDAVFNAKQVIPILAKANDEKAAMAVARQLSNHFAQEVAAKALRTMGPVAEPAVLDNLKSSDNRIRAEACLILAEIGTPKSLSSLKSLVQKRDYAAQAAQRAIDEITKRSKAAKSS